MANKRNEARQKLLAGAFFIIGICLLHFVIFTISKDKGFGQSRFEVFVLFRNVGGLSEGAPVHMAGVNIGTVESVDFLEKPIEGRFVEVILSIQDKFRKQFKDHLMFTIKTQGILGEKLVEITRSAYGPDVDITKPVFGVEPFDVQDIAEVLTEAATSFSATSKTLQEIDLKEMAEIMAESSRALLETSEGINDIIGEFNDISRKSKRLLDRVEERVIEGNLFRFF